MVWDPNVPKMARQHFPNFECRFISQWPLWSGGGVPGGGGTPVPALYSRSNTSLPCSPLAPPCMAAQESPLCQLRLKHGGPCRLHRTHTIAAIPELLKEPRVARAVCDVCVQD